MARALSAEADHSAASASQRSAAIVFLGILASRILGLLRTTLFARYFGVGAESDAFQMAFKIPNAVRNLLGEGTMSASFVPVYSRLLATPDAPAAKALAAAILGILLAAVSVLTVIGIVAAPLLTSLFAPGFDAERAALTTRLTRVLFPMSALMVLSGWCLGIQNSHKRFFWSYASAALWSAAQIVLLVWWGPHAATLAQLAWWLAWATLAGSMLQVAAQVPEVLRFVGVLRPTLRVAAEGVGQTLQNLAPVILGLGVVQISALIDLQIASFLPVGTASYLAYASPIALLPVSLFGVSVAAASLPDFARSAAGVHSGALLEQLRRGWQRIVFYIVPCAVVFVAYGDICIGILLRYGRFGAEQQHAVHLALAGSAIGLIGFASTKLLAAAHYALQDYRTPLRASLASLVVSAIVSIALAIPLRHSIWNVAAITVGSSVGAFVNLGVLARGLRARLGPLYTAAMWTGTRRIGWSALAAVLCAAPVRWSMHELHPTVSGLPILGTFGLVYLVAAWWGGSREAARLLRRLPRE